MLQELSSVTELAVDVEHHSYRSYLGLTCLLQISTRCKDYIVDCLSLRDELHQLNQIFTDPNVVKIFHGAAYDVEWLQRDLGVYVVGMFDTHEAAQILNYSQLSLAALVKKFIGKHLNKQYQLADWRIRPLPEALIKYAREDTHYLLEIYDKLKNELLDAGNSDKNLLKLTYHQSKLICATRYEKPTVGKESMMRLYRKFRKSFNTRQMYAFQQLYEWRDEVARREDESLGYVLPNHMFLAIAEAVPREMQGIFALCNPMPPLVKLNLQYLHDMLLTARQKPLVYSVTAEKQQAWTHVPDRDWNSPLYCPHELTHTEHVARIPTGTLLNATSTCLSTDLSASPILNIYQHQPQQERMRRAESVSSLIYWLSPHERYKLVQPLEEPQVEQPDASTDRLTQLKQHAMSLISSQSSSADKAPKAAPPEAVSTENEEERLQAPLSSLLLQKKKVKKQKDTFTVADVPRVTAPAHQDLDIPQDDQILREISKAKGKKRKGAVDSEEHPPQKSPKVNDGSKNDQPRRISKKKNSKGKEKVVLTKYNKKDVELTPKPHEYNQSDFSRFKGGAQAAEKKLNSFASKFFKKGKRKAGKKTGKSVTFTPKS